MRLLEILVDGVPSTKGVLQYHFETGLNPWKQKGSFPIATLLEVLQALVFPMTREKDPLGPGKCRRAGITFEARDAVYRLVRDFSAKKLQLSQLEPGGQNRFRDLSHESRFIIETLNRTAKVPSRRVFRSLLICTPGKIEDVEPKQLDMSVSAGSIPSPEAHERLEQLKRERETFENSKHLENEQDELQQNLFKIEDDLRKLSAPREELKRVLQEYEPYAIFDKTGLQTSQVISKFKGFKALEEKKESDLKNIEERYVQLNADLTQIPDRIWWKEPLFVASVVIGVGSFVATSMFNKLWFIGFVVSCLTSGAAYFIWHQRNQKILELRKKIRMLDPEKAGIEKRFAIEATAVKKIQEAIGSSDHEDIAANMHKWEELKVERKKAEEDLSRIEAEVQEGNLKAEKEKIQQRLSQIQSSLHDMPAITMDILALNKEIHALEMLLQGTSETELKKDESTTAQDPISILIHAMAEVLEKPALEVILQSQKALDANIGAVTGRTYASMTWNEGDTPQFQLSNGNMANWYQLNEETKSILKFAVQFTFWQLLATVKPLPIWIDLVSHPASERVTQIALSGAKHLATKSQVIVLSN